MKTWNVSVKRRGFTQRNGIVGKCGTQRGQTTSKWRGSLKDGGHGRRDSTGWEEWGGGGTLDGVRTEAGGWFDLNHVCVHPLLFAASWMWWNVGFLCRPVPSVLAQVGANCSSCWVSSWYLILLGRLDVIYTRSCHFESSVHVQPLHLFVIWSLGMGRWKAWRRWGNMAYISCPVFGKQH